MNHCALLLVVTVQVAFAVGPETTTPKDFSCGQPPRGNYATRLIKKSVSVNQNEGSAKYRCEKGYTIEGTNSTIATIRCQVPDGWEPRPNCVEICSIGNHNCDANAKCVPGGYHHTCVCDCGFTGDGYTCDPILSEHNSVRVRNVIYSDPYNEYDQVTDVLTAQDCFVHCMTRNSGACMSFSYNYDVCIIVINEGDLNIQDLSITTTYGYSTYIMTYGYGMLPEGDYAKVKYTYYYLGAHLNDPVYNIRLDGVENFKDCASLCYLINEGQCSVYSYSDRYAYCKIPLSLARILPYGLHMSVHSTSFQYTTSYLIIHDSSGEPLTLSSYSTIPNHIIHRGSGYTNVGNTDYDSLVTSPQDCYRLCYKEHGQYCKVFSYSDTQHCVFPDQGLDTQYLNTFAKTFNHEFTSYLVFHPSSRNETFPTNSYLQMSDRRIRDGVYYKQFDLPYADIENLDDCYRLCLETLELCSVFSYNEELKECFINSADFYSDWTYFEDITGYNTYYLKDPSKWKLLTKHITGYGPFAYLSYTTDESYVNVAHASHTSDTSYLPSPYFLKSKYVDYWGELESRYKIRIELRQADGQLLNYLEFNAVGTTRSNWFTPENFLDSSWSDLSGSIETFDVWDMVYSGSYCRSFYISKSQDNCDDSEGWLLLGNCANWGCAGWEKPSGINKFLYAPESTATHWKNTTGKFDVFKVYMSFY